MFTSKTPLTIDQIAKYSPSALQTQAHESCSARYGFQSTVAIIEGLRAEGFGVFGVGESRTRQDDRRGFLKHMLRFRHLSTFEQHMVKGDFIPELVMVNAMDGSSIYKLMGGIFRMVCENGMVVADSLIQTVSVRHTVSMVQGVLEASFEIAKQTSKAVGVIDEWRSLQLTTGDQHSLAIAAHYLRFADSDGRVNTPIQPDQLLHLRRTEDSGNDLWSTHNRIQENVIKGGLSARADRYSRRVSTREVKAISADVKLNQALWTLSTSLADQKAGRTVIEQAAALAAAAGK
jgi:hypothetical protein